ncbi:GntT/GntP/DsdX family permease [Krasilnikoviella flava]|uniref:Gluconate:H+ symporter, GntP family n=1 Tax=Krasilnikoviella flava TaxID=526729 RepID=A0A1T5KEC8_9MICO|nr:gluconate:H+ symporter [Krasilnikoviella flava]SKC61879.1 gluconate:H+ symporter, GntP family [Krasilnikoviella flava]
MRTLLQAARDDDDTLELINQPWSEHDTQVLVVTAIGIAIVVLLITMLKMHGFVALTLGSLFVAIGSGIPLGDVAGVFETGVGDVLGTVGVLVVLGAMLGKLLADSGGADEIVDKIFRGSTGSLPWRMALIAFLIGIPMFFEVGLVLLIPVIMLAVRRSGLPAMLLAIPALAGLSVLHGFVPPHPGPLAAIGNLGADVGITMALGLLIAVPTVIIAGPVWGRFAAKLVPIGAQGGGGGIVAGDTGGSGEPGTVTTRNPTFVLTLVTILSPVILMLVRAGVEVWASPDAWFFPFVSFIGEPLIALLIAVLLAMITFGTSVGFSLGTLGSKMTESLKPIASATMIVGAGGGFKAVLVEGGTGIAIGKAAVAMSLSVLLLGWLIAVLVRIATGSATVAIVTASGIVAPLATGLTPTHLALVVLAIGAGSLILSHVNDAGFWLVKEYFGMTVGQTFKTWSVMETIIAVLGLLFTWLLWLVV